MKGNIMIRMISLMIIVPILLAHFSGQVDLLKPNWLWLTLFAGLNALQATFTGWCPVSRFLPKDSNTGACCISDTTGTCCSTTEESKTEESKTTSACCGDDVSRETKSNECCSDNEKDNCCSGEDAEKAKPCCGSDALTIKVLGTGCANCNNTVKLIQTTADELDVVVDVVKVEDISEIASYGVMSTPGVVINDKVVHAGGVPSKKSITEWLE